MKSITLALCVAITFATANVVAQVPTATEEHKILKKEVGTWKATVKNFIGPEGPFEEPIVSTGKETNQMIGDFWMTSNFEADMGGMMFKGQGTFGYDAAKKKYVGSWVDSFGPTATTMVGTYDPSTKTMTYESKGAGMDGNPMKGQNKIVYENDDRRVMTMHVFLPGQDKMTKAMEIVYERMKKEK